MSETPAEREASEAMMAAARRLSEIPDLQRDLHLFTHYWGLDAYSPPDHVQRTVRDIVLGVLVASFAIPAPSAAIKDGG